MVDIVYKNSFYDKLCRLVVGVGLMYGCFHAGDERRRPCRLGGVQSTNYWSSSSNADNPTNAWNVNFDNGNVNDNNKTNTNFVWPVRGGE